MEAFNFFALNTRQTKLYETFKSEICNTYKVGQTAFDIIMFLKNHPQNNTAKEICEMRGIKSGIVSVEVENLVNSGYLTREKDPDDRRKIRLYLTRKTDAITFFGKKMQTMFFYGLFKNISQVEQKMYFETLEKILINIDKMEKEGLYNE